jgi:hypothetical protein
VGQAPKGQAWETACEVDLRRPGPPRPVPSQAAATGTGAAGTGAAGTGGGGGSDASAPLWRNSLSLEKLFSLEKLLSGGQEALSRSFVDRSALLVGTLSLIVGWTT